MTNLSKAEPRTFRGSHLDLPKTTMPAGGALWEGSFVQTNSSTGKLENLTGAGTTFAGVADASCEAADERINVIDDAVVRLTVGKATNFAQTDVGAIVYASDGNTFTLTSTSNQKVGRIVEIESGIGTTSAVCWVQVRGVQRKDA